MKILFFDIDGTIWDEKNNIPESTIKSIRAARENGHLCFLNSGRSRAFIRHEGLLGIGFDGIVSACGTMIELNDKIVFKNLIDRDLCILTVETVRKYGFKPILEGPEHLYLDEYEFPDDKYTAKIKHELGEDLWSIDENWGNWEMLKLSCDSGSGQREECFEALSPYYDYMIHNESVVEMIPKGFNKGTGIEKVCELLNADINDTFSFGDSVNDLDMLSAAGIGVAMGNGTDVAKETADHVTAELHDDGIEKAMKFYGLI